MHAVLLPNVYLIMWYPVDRKPCNFMNVTEQASYEFDVEIIVKRLDKNASKRWTCCWNGSQL